MRKTSFIAIVVAGLFSSAIPVSDELYLFGGFENQTYLGCLSCPPKMDESIWNYKGTYGYDSSSISIWNLRGLYGRRDSPFSPFNLKATSPPIIVDLTGNYYGYLTSNPDIEDRADFEAVEYIYQFEEYFIPSERKKVARLLF